MTNKFLMATPQRGFSSVINKQVKDQHFEGLR